LEAEETEAVCSRQCALRGKRRETKMWGIYLKSRRAGRSSNLEQSVPPTETGGDVSPREKRHGAWGMEPKQG
jgi:hypothetical protein